jgi:multidrug efflux pump subunit AcrB
LETLGGYVASLLRKRFTLFGRPFEVHLQSDAQFRAHPEDVLNLKTRNEAGEMVPLGTVVDVKEITGPTLVYHYNLYPSADISGSPIVGVSSGDAIKIMNNIADKILPQVGD